MKSIFDPGSILAIAVYFSRVIIAASISVSTELNKRDNSYTFSYSFLDSNFNTLQTADAQCYAFSQSFNWGSFGLFGPSFSLSRPNCQLVPNSCGAPLYIPNSVQTHGTDVYFKTGKLPTDSTVCVAWTGWGCAGATGTIDGQPGSGGSGYICDGENKWRSSACFQVPSGESIVIKMPTGTWSAGTALLGDTIAVYAGYRSLNDVCTAAQWPTGLLTPVNPRTALGVSLSPNAAVVDPNLSPAVCPLVIPNCNNNFQASFGTAQTTITDGITLDQQPPLLATDVNSGPEFKGTNDNGDLQYDVLPTGKVVTVKTATISPVSDVFVQVKCGSYSSVIEVTNTQTLKISKECSFVVGKNKSDLPPLTLGAQQTATFTSTMANGKTVVQSGVVIVSTDANASLFTITSLIAPIVTSLSDVKPVSPSTKKPVSSTTSKSVSSTTSKPVSPTTSKLVSSSTKKPESSSTEKPVSPTTSKPVSPSTEKPVSPSTEKPVSSTTSKPVSPSTKKPVSPSTEKPGSPTASKPVSPTTEKPVSPTTEKPVFPTTSKPGSPTNQKPGSPSTGKPVSSSTEKPVSSTTSKPVSPTTEKPVSPSTQKPGSSSTEKPKSPNTEKPVSPSTEKSASTPVSVPSSSGCTGGSCSTGSGNSVSSTTTSSIPASSTTASSTTASINNNEDSTVTKKSTMFITLTSCSEDKCHESAVPATMGPTTVTVDGTTTVYTTWCPISGEDSTVTKKSTKLITITSCHENKCHESAVAATMGPTTVTVDGMTTVYTTWCPVSGEDSTVTKKSTKIITVTSCSEDKCHESAVAATMGPTTVTVDGMTTVYTTWCPVSAEKTLTTQKATESPSSHATPETDLKSTTATSTSTSPVALVQNNAGRVGASLAVIALPLAYFL